MYTEAGPARPNAIFQLLDIVFMVVAVTIKYDFICTRKAPFSLVSIFRTRL